MDMSGNTGTQVAPTSIPTENEMQQVQSIFSRMADAVVDASRMGPELASIRAEMTELRSTIEGYRSRLAALDDELAHVRNERNEAIDNLNQVRSELVKTKADASAAEGLIDEQARTIADLRDKLGAAHAEAGLHQSEALRAIDEARALRSTLDDIRSRLSGLPGPAVPEAPPAPPAIATVGPVGSPPEPWLDQARALGHV